VTHRSLADVADVDGLGVGFGEVGDSPAGRVGLEQRMIGGA